MVLMSLYYIHSVMDSLLSKTLTKLITKGLLLKSLHLCLNLANSVSAVQ